MSLSLPPEILDLIADHLHDEPTALRACCLVSKSWVPRTRLHLFNHVKFLPSGQASALESWMKTFPDPSDSPARYTRSLDLFNFKEITVAISDVLPQIHSFNHIVKLAINVGRGSCHISITQLRGLSPNLKSLVIFRSRAPLSEFLDFICSFPLLEDLELRLLDIERNIDGWDPPPNLPKFTGSLRLLGTGADYIARKLLDLPGGLHFSKIIACCLGGDNGLTSELVSKCSGTLQSLRIDFYPSPTPEMLPSINLSRAEKLKGVEFRPSGPNAEWMSAALRSAKSENLQQITIHFYSHVVHTVLRYPADAMTRLEWRDLDHLLVQLWTTRSIRPVFTYEERGGGAQVPELLPELLSRGVFDVV